MLRQLGCLNPLKRQKSSTESSIQGIAKALQPNINDTKVTDEWKMYQCDVELPVYDPKKRIEVFWNAVFELKSPDGEQRCTVRLV